MARKVAKDNHPGDYDVASATAGAATLNKVSGIITSESIATATAGIYTLTLTNNQVFTNGVVLASVQLGSATTGTPQIVDVNTGATDGTVVIRVKNIDGSNAFNGTIKVSFYVVT